MRKLISLLVCIAMLATLAFTLTACGGEVPDKSKNSSTNVQSNVESNVENNVSSSASDTDVSQTVTDEELIVGSWVGKVSIPQEKLDELLGESDEMSEMSEYFDFNQLLAIEFTFNFSENGTYTISVTEESAEEYIDNTVNVVCDGMLELMKDMAEQNDMTWEEFLGTMEMTEQEYKDAVLAEIDKEEMLKEFREEFEPETEYYKFEGGKLYTADDKDFEGDDVEISDYELTENTFKMYSEEGAVAEFTRVK